MKIKIIHRTPKGEQEIELYYDVETAWLEPDEDKYTQIITMLFYEDTPNSKKYKYGETTIKIDPRFDEITYKDN